MKDLNQSWLAPDVVLSCNCWINKYKHQNVLGKAIKFLTIQEIHIDHVLVKRPIGITEVSKIYLIKKKNKTTDLIKNLKMLYRNWQQRWSYQDVKGQTILKRILKIRYHDKHLSISPLIVFFFFFASFSLELVFFWLLSVWGKSSTNNIISRMLLGL